MSSESVLAAVESSMRAIRRELGQKGRRVRLVLLEAHGLAALYPFERLVDIGLCPGEVVSLDFLKQTLVEHLTHGILYGRELALGDEFPEPSLVFGLERDVHSRKSSTKR